MVRQTIEQLYSEAGTFLADCFVSKACDVCLQGIFNTLDGAGQLVEQTIEQLYSEAAGKFLADRFVTGTCPKCQYEVCISDPPCSLLNPWL